MRGRGETIGGKKLLGVISLISEYKKVIIIDTVDTIGDDSRQF